jgi:hypothetical protein
MDGLAKWIDARIEWRVSVTTEPDILFEGRIDTAEAVDESVTRIAGFPRRRRSVRTHQ